jgi:hypothetical protein
MALRATSAYRRTVVVQLRGVVWNRVEARFDIMNLRM